MIRKGEDGAMEVRLEPLPEMPDYLKQMIEENEMSAQKQATFRIWRGECDGGEFRDYTTGVSEGMVVLDAVNHIQATQANDLACRWNCKAGKCGSCSAEVNGMPKLMCMTRLSDLPLEKPVTFSR